MASMRRRFPVPSTVISLLFACYSLLFSPDLTLSSCLCCTFCILPPPFTGIYRDAPWGAPFGVRRETWRRNAGPRPSYDGSRYDRFVLASVLACADEAT